MSRLTTTDCTCIAPVWRHGCWNFTQWTTSWNL